MSYWEESIRCCLDELDIKLPEEKILELVKGIQGIHECEGLETGRDFIPNPETLEIKRLEIALKKEQNKVVCPECHGSGRSITNVGVRSSDSGCHFCHGEGYK